MFENLNKTNVYAYLAGIFFACMIASNILATRTLEIGFIALPCSILTFPILFIVNDILSEIYGFKLTKDVIYLGFIINVVAVGLYQVAMLFPSSSPNALSIWVSSSMLWRLAYIRLPCCFLQAVPMPLHLQLFSQLLLDSLLQDLFPICWAIS